MSQDMLHMAPLSVSVDLSKQAIYELGRRAPYYRYTTEMLSTEFLDYMYGPKVKRIYLSTMKMKRN
jgi:hypothetical protein